MKSKEGIPDEDIEEMLEGDLVTFISSKLKLQFEIN